MTVQLPSTPLFEAALKIINTICAHARQAFFVGGAVRNLLLHKPCKDIDIVSSATPDELLKIFPGA
ncbi:MAG: CCA tRNA nucleotidyltransferase, partial [Lentisphaeria bacterium]|nr:CCA tRNA nucleotidyltransferase [Lentisphaeria bacterium]